MVAACECIVADGLHCLRHDVFAALRGHDGDDFGAVGRVEHIVCIDITIRFLYSHHDLVEIDATREHSFLYSQHVCGQNDLAQLTQTFESELRNDVVFRHLERLVALCQVGLATLHDGCLVVLHALTRDGDGLSPEVVLVATTAHGYWCCHQRHCN